MSTYYVTRIEEPDFGCEGRPEGQDGLAYKNAGFRFGVVSERHLCGCFCQFPTRYFYSTKPHANSLKCWHGAFAYPVTQLILGHGLTCFISGVSAC